MSRDRKMQIGVIGGREVPEDLLEEARSAGRTVAQKGGILLCGGLGGVMEAACRGAREAGGLTVGILPGGRGSDANAYLDLVIPTGMGVARNAVLVQACHGIVAVGGSYGTLSEIAFAMQLNVPLVAVRSWDPDGSIQTAESGREAVERLYRILEELP